MAKTNLNEQKTRMTHKDKLGRKLSILLEMLNKSKWRRIIQETFYSE